MLKSPLHTGSFIPSTAFHDLLYRTARHSEHWCMNAKYKHNKAGELQDGLHKMIIRTAAHNNLQEHLQQHDNCHYVAGTKFDINICFCKPQDNYCTLHAGRLSAVTRVNLWFTRSINGFIYRLYTRTDSPFYGFFKGL